MNFSDAEDFFSDSLFTESALGVKVTLISEEGDGSSEVSDTYNSGSVRLHVLSRSGVGEEYVKRPAKEMHNIITASRSQWFIREQWSDIMSLLLTFYPIIIFYHTIKDRKFQGNSPLIRTGKNYIMEKWMQR
ncbi:MAG: hypothetical protein PUI16_07635 [Clostridia bacterium]|nr:hypothetical protein [Clostridia bacterium]MDY5555480.1 hypothetical protein [Blautia sp.]